MYGRLPVTGVIDTPDVEVVAITVSQGRAGGSLHTFLDVLSVIRDGVRRGIPEDGVAVETAGGVDRVRPGDIDGGIV